MNRIKPFYKAVTLLLVLTFLCMDNVYALRVPMKGWVDEPKKMGGVIDWVKNRIDAVRGWRNKGRQKYIAHLEKYIVYLDEGIMRDIWEDIVFLQAELRKTEASLVRYQSELTNASNDKARTDYNEMVSWANRYITKLEERIADLNVRMEILSAERDRLSQKLAASQKGPDDYGSSSEFSMDSRNAIFGLETKKAGLSRQEGIIAPDLDAGLLNRPGARYYLWNGKKLSYFVRATNRTADNIDPDLRKITPDNREAMDLREFFVTNNIDVPCYVLVEIPGNPSVEKDEEIQDAPVLRPQDWFINIDGEITYTTRLGNMPVLTLGLIKQNPKIALAKLNHEQAAFEEKLRQLEWGLLHIEVAMGEKRKNEQKQHIAGLMAERDTLNKIIPDLIKDNLDLKKLIDDIHSPIYSAEERYYKAVIIADVLIHLVDTIPDLNQAIRAIALEYLNPEKGLTVPEKLSMNLVLNKVGDEKDRVASLKEILKTATSKDGNWDNVTVALKLLPKFEIPETIKDEVSTKIAELLFKGEWFIFYEYCPAILEKTGLTEEMKQNYILGEDFSALYHIMTTWPNIHMIPTLKLLAKLGDGDKRIFQKIKENAWDDKNGFKYNRYAYVIFLGNMDFDRDAQAEMSYLERKYPSDLLDKMCKIYKSIQYQTHTKRGNSSLWNTHINKLLAHIEKNPNGSHVGYYLFMCSEIISSAIDPIDLDGKVVDRFVSCLQSISSGIDSSDIYPFAAKAANNKTLYFIGASYRDRMIKILCNFLRSTTHPIRIAYETVLDTGIDYSESFEVELLNNAKGETVTSFLLSEILSRRYGYRLLSNLEKRLNTEGLPDLLKARKAVEAQLAEKSADMQGSGRIRSWFRKVRHGI